MIFKRFILIACALYLHIPVASAQLIVVDDLGGTPATPYYNELGLTAEPRNNPAPKFTPPASIDDSFVLPIRSTRLSAGYVAARSITAPGLSPLFLIGNDAFSLDWLSRRYDDLLKLGATGLIVQVETAQELANIRRLAPDLQLLPVNGNDLAQRLNLTHYPVLITSEHIGQ